MKNRTENIRVLSEIRLPLLLLVTFVTAIDMLTTATDWRFLVYGQFLFNAIIPVLFFMLLFIVSRNPRFSAILAGMSCAFLYWGNHELYRYWDRFIVPAQVDLLLKDLKITKVFTEIADLPLLLSVAAVLLPIVALTIILSMMALTNSRKQELHFPLRARMGALLAVATVASAMIYGSGPVLAVMSAMEMKPRDWDMGEQLKYGLFNHLYISASRPVLFATVLQGDPSVIVDAVGQTPVKVSASQRPSPDIVVMLAESVIDPLTLRADFHADPMAELRAAGHRNRADGYIRVHTVGGRSWLSEYALLTGIPSSLFSETAVRPFSLADSKTWTIAHTLDAHGYRTIGMYAAPTDSLFPARKTYLSLGFDDFLGVPEMRERFGEADGTDDGILLNATRRLLEDTEQPVFLFIVTHDLHMPYPPVGNGLFVDKSVGTPRMQEYFRRLSVFSGKTAKFLRDLDRMRRPVLFAMFGDHTPPMPTEFEEIGFRDGKSEPLYHTPYLIFSNSRDVNLDIRDFDVSYSPGLILDLAHVDGGQYFRINSAVRQLCHGNFMNCEAPRELMNSYYTYLAANTSASR